MPIIAINIGTRVIDRLLPQQHKEVTEEEAQVYERILPNEIKIVRVEPAVQEMAGQIVEQTIETVEPPQIQEEKEEEVVVEQVEPTSSTVEDNAQPPLTIDEIFGEGEGV